ncbi:MAG: hypothetical protein H6636_01120 [Anaerolineales bacterium]|nr:hypothetical protein [Anaerolineales bacterium]
MDENARPPHPNGGKRGFLGLPLPPWQITHRFDYTLETTKPSTVIEEKVVPVATRLYQNAQALGVDNLRPCNLDLDQGVYPSTPCSLFAEVAELEPKVRSSSKR